MLITNVKLATMDGDKPYGMIEQGALVISGKFIKWVGKASDVPDQFETLEAIDCGGRLATPAPIDCHTHIVYGGNRANEFEMRLEGASYEEVARAGGGIVSTVKATRSASEEELIDAALPRVDALIDEGVTTLEVKSGYGLNRETELNMLRAARQLERLRPIRIKTSFLGAHAIPPEFTDQPDAYIHQVCIPTLDAAVSDDLVDAVDGFCEGIAFDRQQIESVFKRALELGLPVKLHAEQLSNMGGTKLAARYGALSVDHLEYAEEDDIKTMADAGCVAVLLPGAFYTLRETRLPRVTAFRRHNVPIAIATDSNPGSSPLTSILLAMNMACTLFRLTPEEALAGVTKNAARALGLSDCGILGAGMRADLAIWDVAHPAELSYRMGYNPLHRRMFGGELND